MEMMFVMHEIFCLVITNLNLHMEYLIPLDVLTCQSSPFRKSKSTSCCGFMFFIKSTTFSGTDIFFCFSVFHRGKCNWRSSLRLCSFRLTKALFC